MNITLFDDRILVKPFDKEQVTSGGIVVPDSADQTNKKVNGIVMKCGAGRVDQSTGEFFPMPLKEGDIVRYSQGIGQESGIEDYLLMRERDIDCIVEDDEVNYWLPKELTKQREKYLKNIANIYI